MLRGGEAVPAEGLRERRGARGTAGLCCGAAGRIRVPPAAAPWNGAGRPAWVAVVRKRAVRHTALLHGGEFSARCRSAARQNEIGMEGRGDIELFVVRKVAKALRVGVCAGVLRALRMEEWWN